MIGDPCHQRSEVLEDQLHIALDTFDENSKAVPLVFPALLEPVHAPINVFESLVDSVEPLVDLFEPSIHFAAQRFELFIRVAPERFELFVCVAPERFDRVGVSVHRSVSHPTIVMMRVECHV
jgi:hypothetical protein